MLHTKFLSTKKYELLSAYFCTTILVLFLSTHAALANWTSFRGNPQLTGVADSKLPDKLELLWTFKIKDMIESTVTIADGIVYVTAADGNLYAIKAESGESIWSYQATAPIKSSPSIRDGVIYFGDQDGIFHAVDIKTHKMKWQFKTQGEIVSSANFTVNRVLFGSYDGFLYCLDIESGELVWKFETEGYVHATPSIWEKDAASYGIVTGCDGYLRIINIDDGSEAQSVNLGTYVAASPAIKQDHVYCGTYGNEILSVSLDFGDIVWRYQHPDRRNPFIASAALTGKEVIVGGRDKMVHALSSVTGDPLWTFSTKSRIDSSPVIVEDKVFFGTIRGLFIALDIATGDPVWEFTTGSAIVASPSVADGRIYIGTEDGILFCFGEKE